MNEKSVYSPETSINVSRLALAPILDRFFFLSTAKDSNHHLQKVMCNSDDPSVLFLNSDQSLFIVARSNTPKARPHSLF
jgi:hypothetical protein